MLHDLSARVGLILPPKTGALGYNLAEAPDGIRQSAQGRISPGSNEA
jgi:hypothetical protein